MLYMSIYGVECVELFFFFFLTGFVPYSYWRENAGAARPRLRALVGSGVFDLWTRQVNLNALCAEIVRHPRASEPRSSGAR